MSESRHWIDDGAPEEFERLLRAARSEAPGPASVERALLVAGITGAAGLASGTATASATGKTFIGLATPWIALGAISAGAVAVSVTLIEYPGATRSPGALSVSAPRAVQPRMVSRPAIHVSETVPPLPARDTTMSAASANAADGPSLPPCTVSPCGPPSHGSVQVRELSLHATPATSAGAGSDRTLMEEMALVDTARSRLLAGDPAGALKSTSEHSRRFGSGRFVPEMLFLQMQAQLRLGAAQAAADLARELLHRFPNGAQASRAREVLEITRGASKSLIQPDTARD